VQSQTAGGIHPNLADELRWAGALFRGVWRVSRKHHQRLLTRDVHRVVTGDPHLTGWATGRPPPHRYHGALRSAVGAGLDRLTERALGVRPVIRMPQHVLRMMPQHVLRIRTPVLAGSRRASIARAGLGRTCSHRSGGPGTEALSSRSVRRGVPPTATPPQRPAPATDDAALPAPSFPPSVALSRQHRARSGARPLLPGLSQGANALGHAPGSTCGCRRASPVPDARRSGPLLAAARRCRHDRR